MPTRHGRSKAEQKKQKKDYRSLVGFGVLGVIVIIVIIVLVTSVNKTTGAGLMGDAVAVDSRAHVPNDAIPGPYNSNPPAGGSHFDTDYSEKFYNESDLAGLPPHPEGYLVHSLEHGYVIFWYNCQIAGTDCAALKATIQKVMDETGNTKLIAFPWNSIDYPLAMTSWGRIMNFSKLDEKTMVQFVEHNRYQAPEPDAP